MPEGAIVLNNSMTMADLGAHAYFLADEQVGVVFQEVAVNRLLNMGIRRVLGATFYPYTRTVGDVIVGRSEYELINAAPSKFSEKADVEYVDLLDTNGVLVAALTQANYARNATATGEPTTYALVGNTLHLAPIPDAAYQLRVSYRAEVPTLVSTDYPPLTDEQIEAVAYFAVWQMKLKDDEISVSDRWKAEFDNAIKALTNIKPGVYKPSAVR